MKTIVGYEMRCPARNIIFDIDDETGHATNFRYGECVLRPVDGLPQLVACRYCHRVFLAEKQDENIRIYY